MWVKVCYSVRTAGTLLILLAGAYFAAVALLDDRTPFVAAWSLLGALIWWHVFTWAVNAGARSYATLHWLRTGSHAAADRLRNLASQAGSRRGAGHDSR